MATIVVMRDPAEDETFCKLFVLFKTLWKFYRRNGGRGSENQLDVTVDMNVDTNSPSEDRL
jgi:hypothetical protein